jgi:hypothetical protein
MKHVEKARIVVMDVSSAVVAKKMIELRQSCGNIGIALAINYVQSLLGMCVIEANSVFRQ